MHFGTIQPQRPEDVQQVQVAAVAVLGAAAGTALVWFTRERKGLTWPLVAVGLAAALPGGYGYYMDWQYARLEQGR